MVGNLLSGRTTFSAVGVVPAGISVAWPRSGRCNGPCRGGWPTYTLTVSDVFKTPKDRKIEVGQKLTVQTIKDFKGPVILYLVFDKNQTLCLNFIGRAMWTSCDGRTSLSVGLTTGDEDDAGSNNRTAYSVVFTRQLTCRWKWVLEHTAGWEENVTTQLGVADAEWYGLTNYLFYTINPCWSLGLRYEWFADDDGARIDHRNAAGGPPKGMFYNGVPYHWNGLTLGVNWTPHRNITLRSELRGDWVSLVGNTVPSDGPFNDYRDRDQFLWTTDLIVQF